MPFRIYSITISCGDGISPNLTTYLCMQNKDDSHRPCFALLRRVGTLLAVQLKDVLSRHLRATLHERGRLLRRTGTLLAAQFKDILSRRCASLSPKGESYSAEWENFLPYNLKISSLGTCVPLSPKGESFFSMHLRATLHEGESNKKIACYNKMVALLSKR